MDADLVLTVLAVLALVWVGGESLEAWFEGPHPVAFRAGREAIGLAAGGLGVAVYLLLAETGPEPVPAGAAFLGGVVLGYGIAWRGGSVGDFGAAVIWSSPWQVAVWGAGAIVAYVGSGWMEDLTAVGIAVMIGAVGLGAGRFVFGLQSARWARRLIEAEMADLRGACPKCGSALRVWDRFCMTCGTEQPRYCSNCGERLTAAARFCVQCGAEDAGPVPDPPPGALTQRFCFVCSTPMDIAAGACAQCGSVQPEPCSLCGAPTVAGYRNCALCGIDLEVAAVARADGAFDAVEAGIGG